MHSKYRKYIIICLLIVLFVFFIIISTNAKHSQYFLKDAFISEGQIVSFEYDDDKNYAKVNLINPLVKDVSLTNDTSYIEINQQFYAKHKVGDQISVLVGNYDVFKKKYYGLFGDRGQRFIKNVWGIENVFDSKVDADAAYPYKQYIDKAQVNSKVTIKEGDKFFVLSYDERLISVQVNQEVFDKYNENDYVECNIQSIGDFVKIEEVK